MWPFNRKQKPAKSVEALRLLRVAIETFPNGKRRKGDAIIRHLVADCLVAMLGRTPTEEEVTRVCEDEMATTFREVARAGPARGEP